jgi:hypothetical protein
MRSGEHRRMSFLPTPPLYQFAKHVLNSLII